MNDAREAVTAVLDAYKAAVHDKDVAAFAALYDDEVRVFDMWGAWSFDGIESLRAVATGWFGSLGTERVIVQADDIQGYAAGDLAAGHAFLTFAAVTSEGVALRSMNNRISLVLKRSGPSWKIVHQHTSAPADFSTMKVTLRREQDAA